MKHLLIILSILLLSSPVIGQETGVLYLYESSSGFVLKSFGDGKVQPKYKGEITNGKPNGFGVLTYPYGEKSVVGEWKNGKEWNTKHTKKDGTLIGKFENGEWLIWGVLYFGYRNGKVSYFPEKWEGIESEDNKDVGKYEGEIGNGEPNGEFKDGSPNGQGTTTYPDGTKFVGEWKNGLLDGQGTVTYPDGTKYVGEWKYGLKYGQGTLTYPNGRKYVGGWYYDKKHGQGTLTFSHGTKYVGGFKDGVPNGQGTETLSNGSVYVGEWKDGEKNGQGTYINHDGRKYVGGFKDDLPDGQGTETFPDGRKYVYDKYGNITKKYVNGELQE